MEAIKTPKERDSLDLLELVCQLHSRALNYPSKEMHEAYTEARQELESRLQVKNLILPQVSKCEECALVPLVCGSIRKCRYRVGKKGCKKEGYCEPTP